ncbi:ABC transporter substrate-binding protein [Diaminobutyricimonas sp. TR449]|uniref:ABC transporter substrate-binding protein n=1 Tax=Diaminobutyricimonas sp. TR449 TaxID=2708076 RepID=UPI001421738F|nr:ABC transporter substrate-binding protein [Diaminobutyricimonas sp. TR449]
MVSTARPRRMALAGLIAVGAFALAGCASGDPLEAPAPDDTNSDTIVVGSQAYYSNEIIAEIYAQALEASGFEVERQFNIGQREAYLPELESGSVDLFPEYTGNLLQYYDEATEARSTDDVYDALADALPDGLEVLDQAEATDQDSYVVTKEFSDTNSVTSLADLAAVTTPLTLGGNSELETRPYGPEGLQSVYGVTVGFTPIEDSGGPLTIQALTENQVQIVNIFSASPAIGTENLVVLEDPESLFLASHVVPLVNADIADDIADVINAVQAELTAAELVDLNTRSSVDEESSDTIATEWLTEKGLI